MRVIHRASLVFLLRDMYTKSLLTHAVILCNGKQNPYTRTSFGHYVFSNLSAGEYTVTIRCPGYTTLEFTVDVQENQTKSLAFNMPYSENNSAINSVTRFQITLLQDNKPFANQDVKLKCNTKSSFLELVEPAPVASLHLKLNTEELVNSILGQKYVYQVGDYEHEIFISGYDSEKKSYILEEPLKYPLEPGGGFYPMWDIRTDFQGKIIMPLISQFMQAPNIGFSCRCGDLLAKVDFDLSKENIYGKLFVSKAKFENSPLPVPPKENVLPSYEPPAEGLPAEGLTQTSED